MNRSVSVPVLSDDFLDRLNAAYLADRDWKQIYEVLTGVLTEGPEGPYSPLLAG